MTAMNTDVRTAVIIEFAAVRNMTSYRRYNFPTSRRIVLLLANGCNTMHRALKRPWEMFSGLISASPCYVLVTRNLRNENRHEHRLTLGHERLSWSCRPAVNQSVEIFSLASVEVACSNLDPGRIIHVSFFIPSRQANARYTHIWLQN